MQTASGFPVLLRAFRLSLQVEGLRPHTVHYYSREVRRLHQAFPDRTPGELNSSKLREYFWAMRERLSAKTVREAQISVRRFYRFLLAEGEVESDPARDLKLMAFRVEPQPTYSQLEVRQLLLVCDKRTASGIRDAALVSVLFDTGVREGELVSMRLPDFERARVQVTGKTGTRNVPLGKASLLAVERYVRKWRIEEGPLWRGAKGPLTESGVLQIVRRLSQRAGMPSKAVHAFRRAAAAEMKRLGMNDSDILEIMGWKDVTMLRRYTAAVAEDLAFGAHRKASPADALNLRR